MINRIESTASPTALLFKRADVVVDKYALCSKCVTGDYKHVMLFWIRR